MIRKVLILGSGALKIGEAGEFDYSGSQAIKALKEAGLSVILINPNIATVQTSEGMADEVYFLPVEPYFVEQVIKKEKPDGILLSFGGQTALNCGMELNSSGVLAKYKVAVLGTPVEAIETTEDRELFARHLRALDMYTAIGKIVKTSAKALEFANKMGYPVMLRSGFALGGSGSGVAQNDSQLQILLDNAFATNSQVIIEESLYGWKEIEYEVVRDKSDNCITVCNMENMDPVGIHTGESIVVAPSQTLNSQQYYWLRDISIRVIRSLKIVGECNIQFALNPNTGEYRIIEVNARLSRSSALASKATGYPLAYMAAKLALGSTLVEMKNKMTGTTSAFFEPSLDYCVVKMPRWDLDKFSHVKASITSEMKSVGEVMAIGRSFPEAIQKAVRMLSTGHLGVVDDEKSQLSKQRLREKLTHPDTGRLWDITAALGQGLKVKEIAKLTMIDPWFLEQLEQIITTVRKLKIAKKIDPELMREAKANGLADRQIGRYLKQSEAHIRSMRQKMGVVPVVKRIDTMSGEFEVSTNYLFLTYHGESSDTVVRSKKKSVIVLGCGPYAIGTSVEFDWCAVMTIAALQKNGYRGVVINCNPETVSTDYDVSDTLYFEELTLERVLDIWEMERCPVITSMGGQIPNNLSLPLSKQGVAILGTKPVDVYRAEHRESFSTLLDTLKIAQPKWRKVGTVKQALQAAELIGYPLLVRPSFVLSGKGMEVIADPTGLTRYLDDLTFSIQEYPVVMSQFLNQAKECDFDGVAQSGEIVAYNLSEHIEAGGVHSGDSSLILPPRSITIDLQSEILKQTKRIARVLKIDGPFNIQYLLVGELIYVIECNVRASRSFPLVSKATGSNLITLATRVLLKQVVKPLKSVDLPYSVVKVPQFSFRKLRGSDPKLKIEMASTGEVCGMGSDPYSAYLSATLSTGTTYPEHKAAFVSLGGSIGKLEFLASARVMRDLGYKLYATEGTALFLQESQIETIQVGKIHSHKGGLTVLDLLTKHKIDFAVVTTEPAVPALAPSVVPMQSDGYIMRRLAVDLGIPIFTNHASAGFFVSSLARYRKEQLPIKPWSYYLSQLLNKRG